MGNERQIIRPGNFNISDTAYRRIIIWAIVLLGVALYAHTLQFPFVWDGRGYILGNPLVKGFGYYDDILNIGKFAQLDEKLGIPSDYVATFIQRPITYFTFSINYLLGGNNPAGYRAFNIAIHIFNAIIVYLLLERILHRSSGSKLLDRLSTRLVPTATAMFFLVHPLQTESVIYITQRFTSLAAGFYLATVYLYLCSATSNDKRRGALLYWASVVTLLVGMLTKEVVFTAPFVLLLLGIVVLGNPWKHSLQKVLPHMLCLPVIPLLVMLTSAAQKRASVSLKNSINAINFYDYSIADYATTQLCAIASYLRLILLPYGQNADHDYPLYTSLLQGRVLLSLAAIAVIVGSSLLIYRRKPQELHRSLLFFGVMFFFVSISVTSSIIPMAELMVERRTYLPSFGAFLAMACVVDLLRLKWRSVIPGKAIAAGFAVWLVVLCGATYARSEVWRTTVSFWQDAAVKSPNKLRPMLALVAAYFERKEYEKAAAWQKKIIAMYPADQNYYVILEELQYLQGLYTDSIETGVKALSLEDGNTTAYYFLGLAYSKVGLMGDAEQALKYAIALEPKFLDAHLALAEYYRSVKNYPGALEQYRLAATLAPQKKDLTGIIKGLEAVATAARLPER